MEKIKSLIAKVKCTIQTICAKIKEVRAEIGFYQELWEKPEGKAAVKLAFGQLWYLLKKVKPKKIEGDVTFGTGDPALTGQLLGAFAMLYGVLPENLSVTPDFEEQKYEGTLRIKGKLRLIHLVIIAGRLALDRNFRYVVKKILAREGAEHEQQ